jgi:hypothetical protein
MVKSLKGSKKTEIEITFVPVFVLLKKEQKRYQNADMDSHNRSYVVRLTIRVNHHSYENCLEDFYESERSHKYLKAHRFAGEYQKIEELGSNTSLIFAYETIGIL